MSFRGDGKEGYVSVGCGGGGGEGGGGGGRIENRGEEEFWTLKDNNDRIRMYI